MKTTLITICIIFASGCGVMNSNVRSRSMTEYDDGVNPVKRLTVTSNGNANVVSAGLPMGGDMMMAGGYGFGPFGAGSYSGYGLPSVGMVGCSMDPSMCGQWVTTPVVNNGGLPTLMSSGAGTTVVTVQGGNAQTDDPALGGRVTKLENRVDKIQTIELRNACREFMKDPSQVADAAKRQKQTETCKQVLGAK